MNNIYIPSQGPQDWQQFLAEPDKQWKTGYSARSMAYSWEEANGFPREIVDALTSSGDTNLAALNPLAIIPEHKVPLPGGGIASQNDAFVLARNEAGLVAMTIEGKVNESFGPLVSEWAREPSAGKQTRLDYLTELLGLQEKDLSGIYYQLLHRTASAIIEAQRFHAGTAVMLVHSFSQDHRWFDEYARFAGLMGLDSPAINSVQRVGAQGGVELYLGWVVGAADCLTK